ncbi:MAG TPA: group 1 truncated hemoglobin [Sphingomonas sp.]|jgi:hemoglobin|uniref:group I truncated hemoglobin n=1 Tax=Sphingomonas sp. TaxID=28214 RepID=UPI002ED8FC8D
MILLALLLQTAPVEEPVAPYLQSPANAGATPIADDGVWRAFHRREGVTRIVDRFVARNLADPRIGDTFKGQDLVRLRRVLGEQFCYLLGGGCTYTGRSMKDAHKDMGLQSADMGALVENLQWAMRAEGVPFFAQNRLLAKLAPMKRHIVER